MENNDLKVHGVRAFNIFRWFVLVGVVIFLVGVVAGGNSTLLGLGIGVILVFCVPTLIALHISSKSAKRAYETAKTKFDEAWARERGSADMLTDEATRQFWLDIYGELMERLAEQRGVENVLYVDPYAVVRQSSLMLLKHVAETNPDVTLDQFKVEAMSYVKSRRTTMSEELAGQWNALLARVM